MNPVPPYSGTYNSPVGLLSIAANDLGVCSISFAEESSIGPIRPIGPIVEQCTTELHEYFEGKRQTFSIPLAPRGTPFEESVWMALLTVGYGATCSYLDITRRLSNPKAIRAVGRANGSNPVGIVIPCHRIVGSDGSLTGYAGGLWRKRWLLDHEARVAGTSLF
jgi:methylated-DNA-[protein]-cysteine S-methyltransferase